MDNAHRVYVVILVIISCLALTTESNRCFQANEGLSEGCSIPLLKKFPYKTSFTPPCQRHDICYRCGSKFSKSQMYCDSLFLRDMLKVCSRMPLLEKLGCIHFASNVYYKKVSQFGVLFYWRTPKTECNQSWVHSCLP